MTRGTSVGAMARGSLAGSSRAAAGYRNLDDGSKKRKRPRWRENKGRIQGANETSETFAGIPGAALHRR